MGSADGPRFWLQKFLGLIIVGLIFTRAAAGGNPFPTRGGDTTDGGGSYALADSEGNSEGTQEADLVELSALADVGTANGEHSSAWMHEGAYGTHQLPGPEFSADLEAVGRPESASPHDSLQGSASISSCRPRPSRIPCDDGGLPPSFSTVNNGEVGEPGTAVTNGADSLSSPRTRPLPWWRRLWSTVRCPLSRGDCAQTRYRTPFNLNRFALLFAYVVSTILSSAGILSWPSMVAILLRQEAYASVCPSSTNGTSSGDVNAQGRGYLCDEQDVLVQQLYSLGSALSCVVCVLGAFLYGRVGPRVGAVVGQIFTMVGWGLLGLSSRSFPAHSAAISIIAAVAALTSFPTYCVRQLFPRHEQVIIMVLGAAMSASVVMPTIVLEAARWMGTSSAIWLYIATALLPSLLVAAFLIPSRDFLESRTSAMRRWEREVTHRRQHLLPDDVNSGSRRPLIQRRLPGLPRIWHILQQAFPRRTWLSRGFISLVTYRTIILLAIGYYFQSSSRMMHGGGSSSLRNLILFSPLFCILFGLANFVVAQIPLMAVVSVAGLLSYVGPLFMNRIGDYLSTFCFSMYLGSALPQTLAILQSLSTEAQYPALAGVLVMISGLLGSLSAPLYADVTVGFFQGETFYVQFACIVALALQFLWLFFLRSGVRRNEDTTSRQPVPVGPQEARTEDEGADNGKDATK